MFGALLLVSFKQELRIFHSFLFLHPSLVTLVVLPRKTETLVAQVRGYDRVDLRLLGYPRQVLLSSLKLLPRQHRTYLRVGFLVIAQTHAFFSGLVLDIVVFLARVGSYVYVQSNCLIVLDQHHQQLG